MVRDLLRAMVVIGPTTRVELVEPEVVSRGLTYQKVLRAPENMVINIDRDVFTSLYVTSRQSSLSQARASFGLLQLDRREHCFGSGAVSQEGYIQSPCRVLPGHHLRALTLVPAPLRIVAVA